MKQGDTASGRQLSPDEEEVLALIRKRLDLGRQQYGPLDLNTASDDYLNEALEEVLDLAIYLTFRLIQLQRRHPA